MDSTRIGDARLLTEQTKHARGLDLRPAISPFPGNPLEACKKTAWSNNHILVGGIRPHSTHVKDNWSWVRIASQPKLFDSRSPLCKQEDSLSCRSMTENNQKHKSVRWNRRALPMRECSLNAKGKRTILKAYHLFPSLADLNIVHKGRSRCSLFEVTIRSQSAPPPHHTVK